MTKPTASLTDKELSNYAEEHLKYEIWMLYGVIPKLENTSGQIQEIKNVRLESFAIHLRNLIFFLYHPTQGHEDDLYAFHFFQTKENWGQMRGKISPILIKARTRANKELCHLTTARQSGTPKTKVWKVDLLRKELKNPLQRFAREADQTKLDQATRDFILALITTETASPTSVRLG